MSDIISSRTFENVLPVQSRISWSAIFGGTMVALGMYFLLASLGAAVGLSISDRVSAHEIKIAAVVWTILISCAALFVGGLVSTLFTIGENRVEAILSGTIVWSLVCLFLLALSGAGIRSGFNAMMISTNGAANRNWEAAAQYAGIPSSQIADWHARLASPNEDPVKRQEILDAATRIGWYIFAGTWLSLFAAAIGAVVGMGSTFRIVAVSPLRTRVAV